jgi:hypothetical protein
MVNRPKAIGTAAETAVRNYLLSLGYSQLDAHRNVLKGSADEGDVWLRHPAGLIVFEVKAGKMAKTASYGQVKKWYEEAAIERANAKGLYAVLVTQVAGVGYPRAGEWWAYISSTDYLDMTGGDAPRNNWVHLMRMTLADFMAYCA